MAKVDLTAHRLREILDYNADTGVFTWKIAFCRKTKVGAKAGHVGVRGYVDIRIDGFRYRAHHLAMLYVTGRWPELQIDHINQVKSDNSYLNLRLCTQGENNRNRTVKRKTKTGLKGVILTRNNTFTARIGHEYEKIHLGTFGSADDAKRAYDEAATRLHGDFACLR